MNFKKKDYTIIKKYKAKNKEIVLISCPGKDGKIKAFSSLSLSEII